MGSSKHIDFAKLAYRYKSQSVLLGEEFKYGSLSSYSDVFTDDVVVVFVDVGTVTASDMRRMHYVLIILLALTIIQGHRSKISQKNKRLIISELLIL